MVRMSDLEHREVLGVGDRVLGTVKAVLFHRTESRAVGIEVAPPRALYVFERRPHYVLLGELALSSEGVKTRYRKLPEDTAGEVALGYSWQESVVWRGMDVRSADGEYVGVVRDITFNPADGAIGMLVITTGVVGDVAHGLLEVPMASIRGFDGADVIVLPVYGEITSTGGAAKAAAAGVVKARDAVRSANKRIDAAGERIGDVTAAASYSAARAVGRSFRNGLGRKAVDGVKSLMKDDE